MSLTVLGFLTALLQKTARKNNISIDALSWEFIPLKEHESEIPEGPQDGAYIRGIILEGSSWDPQQQCLKEPASLELECAMPLIHFKPVETKRKVAKDPATTYNCPCYYYPVREGSRERPSFMLSVELSSGKVLLGKFKYLIHTGKTRPLDFAWNCSASYQIEKLINYTIFCRVNNALFINIGTFQQSMFVICIFVNKRG